MAMDDKRKRRTPGVTERIGQQISNVVAPAGNKPAAPRAPLAPSLTALNADITRQPVASARPKPKMGAREYGQATRNLGALTVQATAAPYRAARGAVTDLLEATAPARAASMEFQAGLLGRPSPAADPAAPMVRPAPAPAGPTPVFAGPGVQPPTAGATGPSASLARLPPPARPQAPVAAAAPTPAAVGTTPPALAPGSLNTFTGRDGVTRAIGAQQAGTIAAALPTVAPGTAPVAPALAATPGLAAPALQRPAVSAGAQQFQAEAAGARGQNQATNARASRVSAQSFLDPRSANSELLRRFQIAQGGRQTASERRGRADLFGQIMQGIMGGQQISQQAAEAAIAGDREAAAQLGLAQENNAASLQREGLVQGSANQRTAAELAQPQAGQMVTGADGGLYRVDTRTGALAPVTGADGSLFRPRQDAATNADADLLGKILPDLMAAAIQPGMTPEEIGMAQQQVLQQAQGALQLARTGQAPGAAGARAAPPPEAIAMLRKDPTTAAQFNATFGPGAAEAILNQ